MNEEFLYYIWRNRLVNNEIRTVDGLPVVVVDTGERNFDSGPDFLFARIKIGDTEWAGHVEIHVKSSDWYKHKHQNDEAYNNVILHVVYENDKDVFMANGFLMPVVELKGKFDVSIYNNYQWLLNSSDTIACSKLIDKINDIDKMFWMERMMIARLEEKSALIEDELHNNNETGFQDVFYRKIARSFGFKVNGDAFEMLAMSIPLQVLQKHSDNRQQIEAVLYGNAGLLQGNFKDEYPNELKREYDFLKQKYKLNSLNPSVWKFMRMRPNNFPTIRISQFAGLIYKLGAQFQKIPAIKRLSDLLELLTISSSDYWVDHYRFDIISAGKKKILGSNSAEVLIINSVVPFVFVYGKLFGFDEYRNKAMDWLEQLRPEDNKIVRLFKELGFPVKNAMHTQAFIHLKKNYCDEKKCLECAIGQNIMRR